VRLALACVGFLSALTICLVAFLDRGDWAGSSEVAFLVAFVTVQLSLLIIIGFEFARWVVLLLRFVGRKTGLLRHLT
jgi:hypothetical protein